MISVIVPVYNVEAYLTRCIESIVGQTYRDLEIILVDDGSLDASSQMCDEWAKKDGRIKVIHKVNGGLSDARNAGLAVATGEYVSFVDSDDLIHSQMIELLYQELSFHHADVAECGFLKFSDYNEISSKERTVQDTIELTPESALAELILERKIHQIACSKLYRRELLTGVPFPVGKICEDEFWTYKIIGKATKIVCFSTALYYYFQREGSIIHTYSLKRLHCIEAFEERLKYVTEHFPRLVPLANRAYLGACIFHYQMLCWYSDVDDSGEERRQLHRRFCEGDWRGLIRYASWKYKLWYSMFRYLPGVTAWLRNAFKIGW